MNRAISGVTAAIAVLLLLTSCATTKATAIWKDEAYGKQPQRVLVQAVLKNPTYRRIVEDEFVRQFRSRRVEAVSAYTVLPGDDLATKEALEEQLMAGKFDTLLLMRLEGLKKETRVVPATVIRQPGFPTTPMPGGWPGHYSSGYATVYSPSYTVEDEYAVADTGLYDVATGKLIWTATSETRISEPGGKLIKAYVGAMIGALKKDGLVP